MFPVKFLSSEVSVHQLLSVQIGNCYKIADVSVCVYTVVRLFQFQFQFIRNPCLTIYSFSMEP